MMTLVRRFTFVLFILAIPLMFVGGAVKFAFSYQALYEYGFSTYRIADYTGIRREDLSKVAASLISYFNNDEREVNPTIIQRGVQKPVFTEKEVNHMVDVKAIVVLMGRLQAIALVYAAGYGLYLAYRNGRAAMHQLGRGVLYGSLATILLVLLVSSLSFLDFDTLFLRFHEIAFAGNDDWLLDPSIHNLIAMFPAPFWFISTIFLGILILGQSFLGLLLGWQLQRMGRPVSQPVTETPR